MSGICPNPDCTIHALGDIPGCNKPTVVCSKCGTALRAFTEEPKTKDHEGLSALFGPPAPESSLPDPTPAEVLIESLRALVREVVVEALNEDTDPRDRLGKLEDRLSELETNYENHTHDMSDCEVETEASIWGSCGGPE
ncbi:unnamed protein product [marine sediment metagenome]|uniref:Uncharacterized protein n=1 Tax=marine sediment metagenome TaxID=412755 RepID=X0Z5N9_9ZZZZ